MALPLNDSAWPPAPWGTAFDAWKEHEVLRIGDSEKIAAFYSGQQQGVPVTHSHDGQPRSGGVVGWFASRFWGAVVPPDEIRTREHVGWAGDLVTLSADLLFADAPSIEIGRDDGDDSTVSELTTDRLDLIANSDEAHSFQHEGAELVSEFGASAMVVRWDTETADNAWVAPAGADVTIPEFRNGRLIALTCFTEIPQGGTIWRHLERHEKGRIVHALFEGTPRDVGKQRPLDALPQLAYLTAIATQHDDTLGGAAYFETGIQRLTAAWWLNAPAIQWRKQDQLQDAGRSDLTPAVRRLGDSLDEIYSSWLKDIRLGAARLLIPEAYLDQDDEGGFAFDRGRELIRKVSAPGMADGNLTNSIEKVQFAIRTDDHEKAALSWWKRILGAAGYGELDAETVNVVKTATEATFGHESKRRTRDKKALLARQALGPIYGAALEIDGRLFPGKGGGRFDNPTVTFPAESQVDPLKSAQVISLLRAAGVMSTEIAVRAAHDDWSQPQVDEEVARIRAAAPQDPTRLGASNPTDAEEAAARQRLGIDTSQPGGGQPNLDRVATEQGGEQ